MIDSPIAAQFDAKGGLHRPDSAGEFHGATCRMDAQDSQAVITHEEANFLQVLGSRRESCPEVLPTEVLASPRRDLPHADHPRYEIVVGGAHHDRDPDQFLRGC